MKQAADKIKCKINKIRIKEVGTIKRPILKTSIILIVVILLLFSAARSNSTQLTKTGLEKVPSKPIILTMWHQWVAEIDSNRNTLKNAVKEWNEKNPNIRIQADGINGEPYKTKIKTALAAGEAPDLFYVWSGSFTVPYIRTGNILPLDPYLNDGTRDKLVTGILDSCTFDGKVYCLPVFTFIANLYCNTELFQQAGAKVPSNYDELLEAVKALRAQGITPVILGEKDRWPGMFWYDILAMRQAGNQASINALNNPDQFEQQGFKEAAAKLLKLVRAKAFNDNALDMDINEALDEFIQGKAAMIYQGNWVDSFIEHQSAATRGKVVAVPFPIIKDGKGTAADFLGGGVDGFCINMNTNHKEEAVKFLKYVTERAGKEGYLNGSGLPCWKTEELNDSRLPSLAKQTARLMGTGTSFVGWWDIILPATDAEVHKSLVAELFTGKKTPDEFAREMVKLKGAAGLK